MKDLAREKRIYLAIWRKAWKEQVEELVLNMPDYNTAISVRMSMYRTIRPYRENQLHDDAIKMAADKYVLGLRKDPPAIILKPRMTADAAEQLFADLGLDEMDLMSVDEADSLKSLLTVSDGLTTEHQPNPFFTREED